VDLESWLGDQGCMEESVGRQLCRDLLESVSGLTASALQFWGGLGAVDVFVDEEGAFQGLVPLVALLSYRGLQGLHARHAAPARPDPETKDFESGEVIPELAWMLRSGRRELLLHPMRLRTLGTYLATAVTLYALTRQSPKSLVLPKHITPRAADLLVKGLYPDPEWRLPCDQALKHPWLQEASPLSRHLYGPASPMERRHWIEQRDVRPGSYELAYDFEYELTEEYEQVGVGADLAIGMDIAGPLSAQATCDVHVMNL